MLDWPWLFERERLRFVVVYGGYDDAVHVERRDMVGQVIWEARYTSNDFSQSSNVLVVADRILVSGSSTRNKLQDAFAVEYTLDGTQRDLVVSRGESVGRITATAGTALFAHGNSEQLCVSALTGR